MSTVSRAPIDPRLLRHARSGRAGVAVLSVLGAGQAAATLLVAVALARIVTGHDAIALLAAAFVLRAALTWAEQVVAQRTAARVIGELRRRTLRAVLRHGPAWTAGYGSGRLIATLTGGLDALRPWFSGYLPALVLGVALPPLVLLAMAFVDPASALIALVTLPLVPVLGALIGWATRKRADQAWAADARLAGHFLDVVRGLTTLRVFGRAERQITVVRDLTEQHRTATMRVLRVAFLSSTALDLVGTLSVGLIAVEAGLRVAAGSMPLGAALLIILLAPEAYRPLREMAARFHASADASAVIGDVDEVLTDEAAYLPLPLTGTRPGVIVSRLRVRHPGAAVDALVLDGLTVRDHEIVALRGPSGAGKTTALRVLAGLQAAGAGRVSLSGPGVLYLPQRPVLPHTRTVADVFPGLRQAEVTAALATVGLDTELDPSTVLGEHGAGVSSGQRQRLALAALLRAAAREPVVLLLDEPTAHLDAAAERLVLAQLRQAAGRGCAILVTAHRPALLAAADRTVDVTPPATPPQTAAATAVPAPPTVAPGPSEPGPSEPGPGGRRRWLSSTGTAVTAGAAGSLAGIVLTGAAAWLLVRAASLPPVLTLSAAVVLVRGSAVARPLLRYLERLVSHDVAFARLGQWRSAVYAALIPRVPGPRLRRRGDLLTRVVDDVDARADGLLRGRLPAVTAGVTLLVAGGVAAGVTPLLALPLGAGLLIAAVGAPAVASWRAGREEAATSTARDEVRDAVVETVDGIEELAVRPGGALDVPDRRSRELARREARAARTAGLAAALGLLGWGVAVVGTALVLRHTTGLSAEWAAVLLLGVVALGEPVATLPEAALARRRAAAAEHRLAAIVQQPRSTPQRQGTATSRRTDGEVRVSGLVAGWDTPVLCGLDLEIPPGRSAAVLGRSGGGKSTLAAVLAGLLDPAAGEVARPGPVVLVGDEADHVFASTVRENLRLARPAADDDALRSALVRVGLGAWLAGLPEGLDTWLGTGGSTISGGQRRRLATARALLADPSLLVLDEPTEGLDEAGADELMADLLGAAHGRTVLLLTHRTEGLDLVDDVYELREGRLTGAALTVR
ncbi:thiol reductant ABC exporter subunit CydC [Actinoplanes sp. N902-109]|uniref:thiol reductant ABC exporter subunit CydC n=1 Tax=Actinoplanes sp. (strain N902-109) TaxID=649831 RepID=UPI00032960A8|nr:thiol reductant ABC exporter subunit CydC [Actinoplanes sp. N902-109]AGL18097.1 ABC transporter transmembrane protein, type 1 [Actinoplanes sp. N902-109]